MANTTFNRSFYASDMRRNLDLLYALFIVTRKNLTEKITALVPGAGSAVIDAILST